MTEQTVKSILSNTQPVRLLSMKSDCAVYCKLDKEGYGRVWHKGKEWRAHRLLWTLRKGNIETGMLVCHKCDNPACVKISHLWLGTNAENTKDRELKGRGPQGCRHPLYGKVGVASPNFGKKRSEESKLKISAAQTGKLNHMYGKLRTESAKTQTSASLKEYYKTHKKVVSEETKLKISTARKEAFKLRSLK